MDIPNKLDEIKNKLLRHGFHQERDEQQQIQQLQADLNGFNEENHMQQVITLEGDKEFTIQNVQVENHAVQLAKKISQKMSSSTQESNNPLQELTTPFNQQINRDIENNQQNVSNYIELVDSLQKWNEELQRQQQPQQVQQMATDSNLTGEEQKENQINYDQQLNIQQQQDSQLLQGFIQHLSVEMNPNINRLNFVRNIQSKMLDYLTKLTQQEYDNHINELNGQFWLNLYMKLKHYQKMIITQFLFQTAFILTTTYYSFRQFDINALGAKLILMYLFKNIAELYFTNKQMNILNDKLDDYEQLKEKLTEQQKQFQYHIENIRSNQAALEQQLYLQQEQAQSEEPDNIIGQLLQLYGVQNVNGVGNSNNQQNQNNVDMIINKTTNSMSELMAFLQLIKNDEVYKRKQFEISELKERVSQFSKCFYPQEDFLQQLQKQSIQRIKQVLVRQQPLLLFLSYILKMVVLTLTLLNCMILFTDASQQLSSFFFIILWMNFIYDYFQQFALVCLVGVLMVVFIAFFLFTRAATLIKRYKHKQKLKSRLETLSKSKFLKTDSPDQTKECSICLNEYQNDETVVTLNCDTKHVFHQQCIETWVKLKDECPLCRAIIFN